MEIKQFQADVHQNAYDHGWWEPQEREVYHSHPEEGSGKHLALVPRTFGDLIALCGSELSEALEAFRDRGIESWTEYPWSLVEEVGQEKAAEQFAERGLKGKPEGAFVELGDCIIRILDMAGAYGVDMEEILQEKHEYNVGRPYRHGGKKL